MKYYRISEQFGKIHLCVETSDNELTSLTSINESITDYKNLLDASDITNLKVDDITKKILGKSSGLKFKLSDLILKSSPTSSTNISGVTPTSDIDLPEGK